MHKYRSNITFRCYRYVLAQIFHTIFKSQLGQGKVISARLTARNKIHFRYTIKKKKKKKVIAFTPISYQKINLKAA